MPGIFPFMRDIVEGSREIWLLSDTYGRTLTGLESSTTSQFHLPLPEVWAPAQYLIDVGLRPALAQRLSSTYMDFVDRYRNICQLHFDRATHGGHFTEYYREVFIILFKRRIQAWNSQILSIVRVRQAGTPQATPRPERVDIRVDDAAKAKIIARLGLKATPLTSDRMVTNPSADLTPRLEEVSEQIYALSTDTVDSRLVLPESPLVSSTSTSRRYDPFSHVAPQTCFPAPYPPPPAPCLPRSALPTSFIPPTPPRDVRSLTSHNPDMSTLSNLFERMTTTTLETCSRIPRSHGVFYIPDPNSIKPLSPILSPSVAANSTMPRAVSEESIVSPTKPTNAPRRRKIASLPTRRGKMSASPSPPLFDSAGATSHPITPPPIERVVEVTPPHYAFASSQKARLVSSLPSLYSAEASCVAMPKSPTAGQRKVHTLHHKTLPQSQTILQNQALRRLATAGETFSYTYTVSRSPPLVSDTTSYIDSPPTSSDELDTPPSTPPRSRVLLARTSTEDLVISSVSNGIVSRKEPLNEAKLPNNPRQRCMHLDFTKGGWGRDEQPLTFTFSV